MRAIGGADFDEFRAGTAHHVGNAEAATDFDEFATRDDHLASIRKCVEQQQYRSCVVVDDGCGSRASQLAEQIGDKIVAIATLAAGKIEFEIHRPPPSAH